MLLMLASIVAAASDAGFEPLPFPDTTSGQQTPTDAGGPCPPRRCKYPGFGLCDANGFSKDPCRRETKEDLERRARFEALDALTGFQKTQWGMKPAEVAKLFPKAAQAKDGSKTGLVTDTQVAGLRARVYFAFDDKAGLNSVAVSFEEEQTGYAGADQVFDAVEKGLSEKYGGSDINNELLERSARRLGTRTLVLLRQQQHPIPPARAVTLMYGDRAFFEAEHSVTGEDL